MWRGSECEDLYGEFGDLRDHGRCCDMAEELLILVKALGDEGLIGDRGAVYGKLIKKS